MRSLRSRRTVDDQAQALVRARVATLAGAIRAAGEMPSGDGTGDRTGDGTASGWTGGTASGWTGGWINGSADGRAEGWADGRAEGSADGESSDDDTSNRFPVLSSSPSPSGESSPRVADEGRHARPVDAKHASTPPWLDPLRDRLPLSAREWRLGLERGHVAVVVLAVLLGLAGAVILFGLGRPTVMPVESEVVSTGTPVGSDAESAERADAGGAGEAADEAAGSDEAHAGPGAATGGPMVIHVAGLVANPGVVELPAGSRVVDAIEAAGGATAEADLTPLNLARVLSDGEQVLVAADPPVVAPPGAAQGGGDAPAGPVNLNTASATDLETLPGIGPTLAGRILDWRARNGRFSTIDELREVSGIGERRFADLEPLVTV